MPNFPDINILHKPIYISPSLSPFTHPHHAYRPNCAPPPLTPHYTPSPSHPTVPLPLTPHCAPPSHTPTMPPSHPTVPLPPDTPIMPPPHNPPYPSAPPCSPPPTGTTLKVLEALYPRLSRVAQRQRSQQQQPPSQRRQPQPPSPPLWSLMRAMLSLITPELLVG